MTQRQAIGYIRDDAGQQTITAFCRERGLSLATTIHDTQGIERAIDETCRAGGVLIADSIATLADSMLDVVRLCRKLREHQADLVLIAEGVDTAGATQGDALLRVMDAVGDLEYRRLAERLPYGYEVADDLEHIRLNPEQAEVIRRIVKAHADGTPDEQTADELNAEGIAARDGGKWDAAAVKQVVDHAPTSRWPFDDDEID